MRTLKLILVLGAAATLAAWAQAGSGSKYGSRDPKTCAPSDLKGVPTADQARQLFICATEQDLGESISLVEEVRVEVAPTARKFQPGDAYNDIDQNGPIYPIQGSFTLYTCRKVFNLDASHTNVGKNCNVLQQPHAQGICYKTTFGKSTCKMRDPSVHFSEAKDGMPPPK